MKIIALTLFCFTLFSCSNEKEVTPSRMDTVKLNVRIYMNRNLNDPGSYEPATWGSLRNKDSYSPEEIQAIEQTNPETEFLIGHEYRAKNGFGALIKTQQVFLLDSALNVLGTL